MAQRAPELAERPSRSKRNRGAAKHPFSELALEGAVDESPFARVTADLVMRARNAQSFALATPADSSNAENKNRFLGSAASLLVYKGEAEPSVLEAPSKETGSGRHQANAELRRLRNELAGLRSTLADREAALAEAALDHEKARENWQSAETARLAEAETKWRQQSASSQAELLAQAEAARTQPEEEVRRLHDELAALRSTLRDREAALAQAAADHEKARENWRGEIEAAEHAWKSAESSRLTDTEAKWREQSARLQAELRAEAEAVRNQAARDMRGVQDQLAALQATLRDREAALAKAEQAWKAAETARLAEAEAKWREDSTRTLAELRAEVETARYQADENIRGLQDQLATLQVTIADREAALAKAALETQQVRDRGRQDLEAALAKAKAWQAEEAARFAAAQAEWQKKSANALNEATARYQTAEGMLTQLRMQSDRARTEAVGGSIKSEKRANFGGRPAEREAESVPIRLPTREERGVGTQDSKVVIRPKQINSEHQPPRKRGAFRDIVVVAALAIAVIVIYPRIEPLLPEALRSNIAKITSLFGPAQNFTAQGFAAVASDVNLRAAPSTTARVIATLPRGLKVATIERRGEWTFVQVEGEGNTQPRRGWVFSSFLKEETGEVEDDDETSSGETE